MTESLFSEDRIEDFKRRFNKFKKTKQYEDRLGQQKYFVPLAKELIMSVIEQSDMNGKSIEAKTFEGWLTIFSAVNSDGKRGPTNDYIESYIKKYVSDKAKQTNLIEAFKNTEYRGFTSKGKTGLTKINSFTDKIADFLRKIEKAKTTEDVRKYVEEYESLKIPELSDGVYSPWIYYLNPKLCPISNSPVKKFLKKEMNTKKDFTYLQILDSLSEIKQILEVEDFGLVDAFITNSMEEGDPEMSKAEELAKLLEHTHNLILHGAPGTGKTYLAREIAEAMGCSDNEIGFVQFHPSYDYTDFVEGLRPVSDGGSGQIGFERKDGVFKKFCEKALKNLKDSNKTVDDLLENFKRDLKDKKEIIVQSIRSSTEFSVFLDNDKIKVRISNGAIYPTSVEKIQRYLESQEYDELHDTYDPAIGNYILNNYTVRSDIPFVFIIDEINRGEMSKIFGELFFSIDPGYRGKDGLIKTQYQNLITESNVFYNGFYVPENVYIIGTMNDIDRNVESMDFAFRRRFTFKEITAKDTQEQILLGLDDSIREEATKRMDSLNDAISKIEGLSSAYHIGGAYFLKLKDLDNDFGKLWEYHLEGLLREYLRGMENAESKLEDLERAYNLENSASQQG